MATSAWGSVRADTITRVEAISPSHGPERYQHRGITRAHLPEEDESGRTRAFRDTWKPGPPEVQVFGTGEVQEARDLILRTYYSASEDLDDYLGHDQDDLMEALDPRSTYPSGTWGALMVRRVLPPEAATVLDRKLVVVEWVVRHIYRRPVTLA